MKSATAPVVHREQDASNFDPADPVSPYEYGLRAAFEHAISGIALLNGRGCILDCNSAMSTMLARPIIELADVYIGDLVIPDDRVTIDLALLELRQGASATVRLSLRCPCGNGRTAWFDASIAAWAAGTASAGVVIEVHE